MRLSLNYQGKRPRLMVLLTIICSILIVAGGVMTAMAYTFAQQRVTKQADLKFREITAGHVKALFVNLETYANALYATRGMFAAVNVDATTWDRFLRSQSAPDRYAGMRAIAYAEIIPQAQLKDYERKLQSSQHQEIKIHPLKDSGDYIALTYLEEVDLPDVKRVDVLGMDLASDQEIYNAIKRADKSGEIAATGQIDLPTSEYPGFLFILPLVDKLGTQPAGGAAFGYAIAAFHTEDFINETIGDRLSYYRTSLTITDVTDGQSITMFQRQEPSSGRVMKRDETIQIADRTWRLSLQASTSNLLVPDQRLAPVVAIVMGVGFITVICILIYVLRLRRKIKIHFSQ